MGGGNMRDTLLQTYRTLKKLEVWKIHSLGYKLRLGILALLLINPLTNKRFDIR